jgi:tetratricopeptide (TPR) repeat protein
MDAARSLAERSVELCREAGDARETAYALNRLGNVAFLDGDIARAAPLYEEALELAREARDEIAVSRMIGNLGATALSLGDYERAIALCRESFEIKQRHNEQEGMAISLINLGVAALLQGRLDEARASLADALARCNELGHGENIVYCCVGAAALVAREGDVARAARVVGACDVLCAETGMQLEPLERRLLEEARSAAIAELGAEAAALIEEGRRFTLADAACEVGEALSPLGVHRGSVP